MDLADRIAAAQRRNAAATAPRPRSQRPLPAPSPSRPAAAAAAAAAAVAAAAAPVATTNCHTHGPLSTSPSASAGLAIPQPVTGRHTHRAAVVPAGHHSPVDPDYNHKRSRSHLSPNTSPQMLHVQSASTGSPAILSRPKPSPQQKLFNPDLDPIPMRPRQHETRPSDAVYIQEHTEHLPAYASRGPRGHLFDPRKDDPLRFTALTRASQSATAPSSQQSSVVDPSSMSSYTSSTAWTLTSNTTASSSSSAPPNRHPPRDGETGVFMNTLKTIYREISDAEKKLTAFDSLRPDADDAPPVVIAMLKPGESTPNASDAESDRWKAAVDRHKALVDLYERMLLEILQPIVPVSMQSFVTKYNIPNRMWGNAFYHCLEVLRRGGHKSLIALEHMHEFIIYGYGFYQALYERSSHESSLWAAYKGFWLEALGDLAQYRMAISQRLLHTFGPSAPLTADNLPVTMPRIDDTPPPSIGLEAARLFDLEPEREIWRKNARTWYASALKDVPGTGRLLHHLGLLCREVPDEELRGVFHFVKSMTALNAYPTSRESIQPLFAAAQSRRNLAEAKAPELFVLLHGMLFTHIQLDDFHPTLARFLERLQLDGAQERDWIMMAVVNVGALLEYGKSDALLRPSPSDPGSSSSTAARKRELVAKMGDLAVSDTPAVSSPTAMEVDSATPTVQFAKEQDEDMQAELPYALQLTIQLAMEMFSFCLRHPTRRASAFAKPTLNPYITVMFTFLSTALKQSTTLSLLEKYIPWEDLTAFLSSTPRGLMDAEAATGHRLTSGCTPLPEDWCLRGMEWLGRRVYERGFWKPQPGLTCEGDVLENNELNSVDADSDGVIEDADVPSGDAWIERGRWVRIARAALFLSGFTGVDYARESGEWGIGPRLREKVERWRETERREREEEERRRVRTWEDLEVQVLGEEDGMEIDEEYLDGLDDQTRALLEQRRRLQEMQVRSSSSRKRSSTQRPKTARRPLSVLPGYSILVVDTNVFLRTLSMVTTLVESDRWTVVIPLAVITELDGLAADHPTAAAATKYIAEHIRSPGLKVQTSRGNYLSTLNVRSEKVTFSNAPGSWERTMDDLILSAALWQDGHWFDRSALLRGVGPRNSPPPEGAYAKVVLVSFDRNLRLKARARQLEAADENDLGQILAIAT